MGNQESVEIPRILAYFCEKSCRIMSTYLYTKKSTYSGERVCGRLGG